MVHFHEHSISKLGNDIVHLRSYLSRIPSVSSVHLQQKWTKYRKHADVSKPKDTDDEETCANNVLHKKRDPVSK